MATYSQIKEFDNSEEKWSQYVECLGHYFLANDIDDAKSRKPYFCPYAEARYTNLCVICCHLQNLEINPGTVRFGNKPFTAQTI